ncbi:hypothetical protein OH492_14575 [Vibrio chagasii]|nr:hypothetical protein [Vibrio chagasii]
MAAWYGWYKQYSLLPVLVLRLVASLMGLFMNWPVGLALAWA